MKIVKQNDLSKSEKNVATMLESYENFEQMVRMFRSYLDIPTEGHNFNEALVVLSQINKKKLDYAVNYITNSIGFPNNWVSFFSNILLFNVATKPSGIELKYYPNRQIGFNKKPELHLVISEQISRDEIKNFLYRSNDLVKYLTKLPKVNDLSRITIAKDYQLINKLQYDRNGNKIKTNKDIAEKRKERDLGKRVADIKYETKKYIKNTFEKKSTEERIIDAITLDLK